MNKTNWTRRDFIQKTAITGGLMTSLPAFSYPINKSSGVKKITIQDTNSNFEREPMLRPFGFKGGFMTEIWQNVVQLSSGSGYKKIGLGSQNVLWSDANIFSIYSESGGNALMYSLTEYALRLIEGSTFTSPIELLDEILDEVYRYGRKIIAADDLRKTFALNALVSVDNAAWLLYSAENNFKSFDAMVPEEYRDGVSYKHKAVASIPSMAFGIPISEIKQAADEGYFFMKIKLGQPGSQKEMLQKDMQRLTDIHKSIGHRQTEHTENGKLPYYLDPNGRYQSKETVLRLLDHADKIGALDQIVVLEEPFPEHLEIDVSDLPVRVAADESAHTDKDALKRIQMGYTAIALKAIAKTLSMTLKIAQLAKEHGVPCLCADLTVNPILIDWNKNVAARLDPLPGFDMGLMETNGHQNYSNWTHMESKHPFTNASWRQARNGVFELNEDFYAKSGGILHESEYYKNMFRS